MRCFLIMMLAVMIGLSVGPGEARAYAFLNCGERLETLTPCPSEPSVTALADGFPEGLTHTDTPDLPGDGEYVVQSLRAVNGPAVSDPEGQGPVPPSIFRLASNSGPGHEAIPTALSELIELGDPEAAGNGRTDLGEEENPIPEPATMVLLGISMISLASYGRFRMKD